jgi:hypothetical protein
LTIHLLDYFEYFDVVEEVSSDDLDGTRALNILYLSAISLVTPFILP